MNLSLKPKYIPLVQKPSFCGPACLQMILYRRGYGLFDQQDLAKHLKVKIGKGYQKFFTIKFKTYTRTGLDEGMKTIESEQVVNRFFKANNIKLTAKAVRASEIKDIGAFIHHNLKLGNDLWMEYKSHKIHKEPFIHDSLIESIQGRNTPERVIIVDPGRGHKPRKEITNKAIVEAVSDMYGRETGFLVISATK